jgi:leader peptidase (prepilin peptidase)/N-methyltransferase
MTPFVFVVIATFILGALIGSFLNVCIYRIPAGLSIVHPGSRCPYCETPIRWYQNIPLLSWLALRGHCAHCKASVSWRYPLIEASSGGLFLLVFLFFGLSWSTLIFWVFVSLLLVVTFIDLDHQIIPNVISLPGTVVGFACSFLPLTLAWQDSALGVLFGAGLLWSVAAGYRLVTGADGMGMGDVKLLAMIGAFLGWQAVLPVVFIGSVVGSVVGIPIMLLTGKDSKLAIPFGPFLSLGAVIYLFWWSNLFNWYVSAFFPSV